MADGPQMRLDAALDEAFGPGKAAPRDFGKQLGDSLIEGIMGKVAAEAPHRLLGGSGDDKGAGGLEGLIQTAQTLQALKSLFGGGGGAGGDWQDGTMGAMARMFESMNAGTTKITEAMMALQAKSEERTQALIRELNQQFRDEMKELREKKGGAGDDDPFKQIGLAMFQQQIQRDPAEEERQRRQAYWDEFERQHGDRSVVDFDRWKFEKTMELEDRKEQREAAERASRTEAQSHIAQALAAAFGGRADPARASEDAPPPPPSLHRYKCGACQQDFALPQPLTTTGHCPHCGELLEVAPPGTPPAGTPPDEATPAATLDDLSADGGY